jgi:hypothetical protein
MTDKPVSPYGVPAESVAEVVPLSLEAPLAPFERDQLLRLVNQYDAAGQRIQDAFRRTLIQRHAKQQIDRLKVVKSRG